MDFNGLLRVSPEIIDRDPDQPRRIFNESALEALARSISEVGLLQPLLVRGDGKRFCLIAGERRLIASRMAGLDSVPVVVVDPDPSLRSVLALVENIHRKDLSSLEQAMAIGGIMERTGWTQSETGRRIGLSQPSIANKMRLLELDSTVQEMVLEGTLGERHARALIPLSPQTQREIAERSVREGLTARIVEKIAARARKETSDDPVQETASLLQKEIMAEISEAVRKRREKGLDVRMKIRSVGSGKRRLEILVTVDSEEVFH
ncbi:MAG TPA: ParB/RepB/Spo0J family partition protein [Synergistetes bacterium]|nr:ParB/RepB/Spo0J family partition protein [Synergistota bacterium]